MNIPIAKTVFTDSEFEKIIIPLKTGWVVQGPFVREFEQKWCNYTGIKNSVAVSNCTTALHLSLSALGIGPGDEVIVPSFTWVATANAVEYNGAKAVLCDIDLDTFNIDVLNLQKLITKKTKAIIPVHLFGLSAEMNEINKIANENNIFIIEDAACGFGSRYFDKHVGSFGATGCFSFHPRKAITTGEGGMITTNNDDLAAKLRSMRDHGASVSDHQRHLGNKPYLLPDFPYLGYNYRMTDIQASIGSSQMERANKIHEERVKIADMYDNLINEISWLQKPFRNKNYTHGFQSYVCLFNPEKIKNNTESVNAQRNKFMEFLQNKGISTRPGTHSVHMLSYYKSKYGYKNTDYINSYIAASCSIAFPLFPGLKEDEFNYIAETLKNYNF
ncbi:MAG: DegT/DnrJ/EryC1/StrS family aminotransferase [Ignavibacteria bacterium]|nr:DegT/DnrJ/EryC1/StrS family aminotransferase [Ignavibacteria bacterium]